LFDGLHLCGLNKLLINYNKTVMDRKKDDDYEEEEIEMGEAGQGLVEFNSTAIPKSEGPIAVVSEDTTYFDIV
jgi:hypothetical protein